METKFHVSQGGKEQSIDASRLVAFAESLLHHDGVLLVAFLRTFAAGDDQLEILQEVAQKYVHILKVSIVEFDDNKKLRSFFNVMGSPTYLLLKRGVENSRMLGKTDAKSLHLFIRQALNFTV